MLPASPPHASHQDCRQEEKRQKLKLNQAPSFNYDMGLDIELLN